MIGALFNVGFRWTGWKRNNNDQKWNNYWKKDGHLAFNIQNLIIAVVLSFVWLQNLIPWLVERLGYEDFPEIAHTAASSIAAGFILETLASRFVKRFGKK